MNDRVQGSGVGAVREPPYHGKFVLLDFFFQCQAEEQEFLVILK